MNYEHARLLAGEVITEACAAHAAGAGPADRFDFDTVMERRWPRGKGGVGMSHGRTQRAVRAAIQDFYVPDECHEPTGMNS